MNWPLNTSQFTLFDRLKLALFFLNGKNFWTQNKQVQLFEKEMAEYVGVKYAVFVSSGSTANTILAMMLKDDKKDNKKKIVFPSTTWTTSIAPFIREGFEPVFLDISSKDFSLDLNLLDKYLEKNHKEVKCIFITSLLGFVPDINKLAYLRQKYKVRIMMDNCENTLGFYNEDNVSSFFTSTTSTYFGHQIQSVEGGFLFTNNINEYEYFLLARNHGMTRSLPLELRAKYMNHDVDSRFDFNILGNNFRNTDVHAKIGRLDLLRINKYINNRINKYEKFYSFMDKGKYYLPDFQQQICNVPFCLPIILKNPNLNLISKAKKFCDDNNIETRPIISGNLLRQTCYKTYGNPNQFPNSEYLHKFGFYVGLHNKVTTKQIKFLTDFLNKLKIGE